MKINRFGNGKERIADIFLSLFVFAVLMAGIQFGAVPLAKYLSEMNNDKNTYDDIRSSYTSSPAETSENTQGYSCARTIPDFTGLSAVNKDIIGWIQIPGTAINYPVVHSQSGSKYLKTNLYGRYSISGTIFSYGGTSYDPPSQNIVLYGHNMRAGDTMFTSLLLYKNKTYYQQHQIIYFETLYHTGTYEVFAAFDTNAGSGFSYTVPNFDSADTFKAFTAKAKQLSYIDTGITIPDDAEIITLSTCDRSYNKNTGRFVVMAVKTGD